MQKETKKQGVVLTEVSAKTQFPMYLEFTNYQYEAANEKVFRNIFIISILIGLFEGYYYRKVSYELLAAIGFIGILYRVESSKKAKAIKSTLAVKVDENGVYFHPLLVEQYDPNRYIKSEKLVFVSYIDIFDWYFYDSMSELKIRDLKLEVNKSWPDRYIIELRNNKKIMIRRDFLIPIENQLLSFMRYFLLKHAPNSLVAQLPIG